MRKLDALVVKFFQEQNFVIVSTIDKKGFPHSSCKGIVKIDKNGNLYLLDVYFRETHGNLIKNPKISITAVNEHSFKGYCLKGSAKILDKSKLNPEIIESWENKISGRAAQRLLKNVREEKSHLSHPEVLLPKPEYMIAMEVEEIVDLTPLHLKK
ncbi:MAG: pyridoxamine 5'-phosphate oxidase family protein [Candidatus Omnitrophota bacterium]